MEIKHIMTRNADKSLKEFIYELNILSEIFGGEKIELSDIKPVNNEKLNEIAIITKLLRILNNLFSLFKDIGESMLENINPDLFLKPLNDISPILKEKIPNILKNDQKTRNSLKQFFKVIEYFNESSTIDSFLTIPWGDPLMNEVKTMFLENFNKANQNNKKMVKKLVNNAINFTSNQPEPEVLFNKSSLEKLGLNKNEILQINLFEIFSRIVEKEKFLLNLEREEVEDIIRELLRRFRESIETYFKLLLAITLNLIYINKHKKLVSFHENLGFYLKNLKINDRYDGDFLDFRNAIAHNSYRVNILNNKINVKVIFKRFDSFGKEIAPVIKIYYLNELRKIYKHFNSYYFLFKEYIKQQSDSYL